MGVTSQSTNVRHIKQRIQEQTYRGRGRVYIGDCQRVIDVRTVKGQLQVRTLAESDQWQDVDSVTIE